jgi:hypothetical protein
MYQPVKGKALRHVGSSGLEKLKRALGYNSMGDEITVSSRDIDRLHGLAAGLDPDERAAIEELIDAIERHDAVRVWGEY